MRNSTAAIATVFTVLGLAGAAHAGQGNLSFLQQANGSATNFNTLPTVNVVITDYLSTPSLLSNQLQFQVTLSNTSAYPTETLTQLFLDDSAFLGLTTLPTVTVTPSVTGGSAVPSVTLSSTKSLSSGAVTAANADTGKGDFQLSFLNNGTPGVLNAGSTLNETFTLTFTGLSAPVSALTFDNLSTTTTGLTYGGVAAFTNVNATTGGLGALVASAVPEPSTLGLMAAGLALLAFAARRRASAVYR